MKGSGSRRIKRTAAVLLTGMLSAGGVSSAFGQTTASWVNAVNGTWTDPAKWTSNPSYPNNGLPTPSAHYSAIINTAGSYTITLGASVSVDGLTLNSTGATLVHSAGTFQANTIDLESGTYLLAGGTIKSALITGSGALAGAGTLSGVTLDMNLTLNSSLRVVDGLSLANGKIIHVTQNPVFPSQGVGFNFANSSNLTGNGAIVFDSATSGVGLLDGTIGSGITLQTGLTGGEIGGNIWTSQGLISSQTSGQTLKLNGQLTNTGTMQSMNGGTLWLSGNWTNSGTLIVNASTVILGGSFSSGGIGNIVRSGGTFNITGFVENTGQTFTIDAARGDWSIGAVGPLTATIHGGTITSVGGNKLRAIQETILDGVTFAGDAMSGVYKVQNGLTLAGAIVNPSGMNFIGSQTLGGNGEFRFDTANTSIGIAGTLNIGSNVLIHPGTADGAIEASSFPAVIVNHGTLAVDTNHTFVFLPGTWSNDGHIVVSAGTLDLGGSFTTADLTGFQRTGGTVELAGTLTNTGQTLDLDALNGSWNLTWLPKYASPPQGRIVGGRISGSTNARLIVPNGASPTLDGVTLAAPLDVGSTLNIQNGLTFDGGTILLGAGSIAGKLQGNMTQSFSGTGEIVIEGTASRIMLGSLTIGTHISIRNENSGDAIIGGNGAITINQGTLTSAVAGRSLVPQDFRNLNLIQSLNGGAIFTNGSFTNNGTIAINSGGMLTLSSGWNNSGTINVTSGILNLNSTWINTGTITATNSTMNLNGSFAMADINPINISGSTINLNGTLNNGTTTLAIDTTNSNTWLLAGGRINGGTVAIAGDASLSATGTTYLDGVSLSGQVNVGSNGTLNLIDGLTMNDGSIRLNGDANTASISIANTETISGSGTILFDGASSLNRIGVSSGTLTIGSGIAIATGLQGGTISGTSGLVNLGLISARTAGQTLFVSTGTLTNSGTLEAKDGGQLIVQKLRGNAGKLAMSNGGVLNLTGSFTIDQSATINSGNTLFLGGTWSNSSNIVATGGTLNLGTFTSTPGNISLTDSTLGIFGTLTTAQILSIPRTNTIVSVGTGGFVNNVANTIALDAAAGTWKFAGGTISSGTMTGSGGPFGIVSGGIGTLTSVSVNAGISASGGGTLNLFGAWSNTASVSLNNAALRIGGTPASLDNVQMTDGTLITAGSFTTAQINSIGRTNTPIVVESSTINNTGDQILTDQSHGGWKISGGTILGGTIGSSDATSFDVTRGSLDGVTIQAPLTVATDSGFTLSLRGAWKNQSTITINAGTVGLFGTFTGADMGAFVQNGGSLALRGTIDNTGQTLDLTNHIGPLYFNGGTINGGTVHGDANSYLIIKGPSVTAGTLNAVTLNTPLSIFTGGSLNILNGLTLNDSTISYVVTNGSMSLDFQGTQVLSGTGTIIFDSGSRLKALNGTVTLGSSIFLRSGKDGAVIQASSSESGTIVNQAVISSQTPHEILFSGNITNQGVIQALNGGSVTLPNTTLTNYTAGVLTGGTWNAYAGSSITLGSSTITTNAASITLDGVNSTFAAINSLASNPGRFTISSGRNFTTLSDLSNSGTIVIGSGSTLRVAGNLNNTGHIDVDGSLIVDFPSGFAPLDDLPSQNPLLDQIGDAIFSSGLAGNPWLGLGSADNSFLGLLKFNGQDVDASTILFKLTSLGDADLNGTTDSADFARFVTGYQSSGSGWINGDFNYDGHVTLDDFTALAAGFYGEGRLSELSIDVQNSNLSSDDQQQMQTIITLAPEPGMASLLALCLAAAASRRVRTRSTSCRG